jgi:hypothetical protein
MKNLRKTKYYKTMTPYLACGLAEGFEEADNETEVGAAWQYIWDTGLWKSLQGWYGRTVHDLVENGLISK